MRGLLAVLSLTAVGALSGCGGAGEANSFAVEGTEYAFATPDTAKAGAFTMDISNTGKELHEFAIGRLAPGKTLADVKAYLASASEGTPDWFTDVGGVPVLTPGEKLSITRDLQPGRYVLLCFLPSPKGVPHVNLGMIRAFTLTGDSGNDLPTPDAVVTATRNGYAIPEIESGEQTIELRNADSREREFFLFTFKPGKTLEDLSRFFDQGEGKTTPPATFHGAMQTIPAGTSVFLTMDFKAGVKYNLADNTGDRPVVATFTPHD